jgi:hypothetical protein
MSAPTHFCGRGHQSQRLYSGGNLYLELSQFTALPHYKWPNSTTPFVQGNVYKEGSRGKKIEKKEERNEGRKGRT